MTRLFISADVVRPVHRLLEDLGADLPPLSATDAGIEIGAADAMMIAAAAQLGEAIGVEVAAQVPLGALGPVDYALSTSATVRDGLTRLSRFYGIATERLDLSVIDDPVAGFELTRRAGVPQCRYWIEFSLALILQRLRAGVGAAFTVDEVTFIHERPSSQSKHEEFFGAPVRFGAASDRLAVARDLLDAPLRTSQPFLAQALQRKLDEIESAVGGDPILRRVCKAVSESLTDPHLGIDAIAGHLAMSRRSLQRHLGELGTSFRAVLDDIRCQRAHRLLEEQELAPAEIAQQLGFADASAFFRAFRRWTGETPGNLRARAISTRAPR
jgi:AraC-like DNA-binding protein